MSPSVTSPKFANIGITAANLGTWHHQGLPISPQKAKNKATEKLAAFYRFTTTEIDMDASTFKEALGKQNYAKDECFLNTLYDFYRDNLLKADGKRNPITRESILKTIGKTEQNVKDGLLIEDVLPFFVKHRLVLRVFDKVCKVIFYEVLKLSKRTFSSCSPRFTRGVVQLFSNFLIYRITRMF